MNDKIFKSYIRELEHLKSIGIIDNVKVAVSSDYMNVSYTVISNSADVKVVVTPKKVDRKDEIRHVRPHPAFYTEQEISTNGITLRFVEVGEDGDSAVVNVYAAICHEETFSKEVGRNLTKNHSALVDTFYPDKGSNYYRQWVEMLYPNLKDAAVDVPKQYKAFKTELIQMLKDSRN